MTVLWRVTNGQNPYFAKGSFWALHKKDALEFQTWWERDSPIPERKGQRQLYSVEIDLTAKSVLDFRQSGRLVNPDKLLESIEEYAELGIRWLVFFGDRPWPRSSKIRPEAIYLGDGAVPATPA